MRSVVIGADGFVGRWLVRHLLEHGDEVHGTTHVDRGTLHGVQSTRQLDVRNRGDVERAISNVEPEAVYYLAGVSSATAREDLRMSVDVSVGGALNTLIAAASLTTKPKLLLVGSSHMYRHPDGSTQIDETWPIGGSSIYGAAKTAAEVAAFALGAQMDIPVIAARPFNHIGPGQSTSFVVPALAKQIAEIHAGTRGTLIRTGALDVERDFTDVRDVVRAYRLLIERGQSGTPYNVASGRAVSVRDVLTRLLEMAHVRAEIAAATSLVRASEPATIAGDASRLRELTGWRPDIPLEDSLRDVLDEAMRRTSAAGVVT